MIYKKERIQERKTGCGRKRSHGTGMTTRHESH